MKYAYVVRRDPEWIDGFNLSSGYSFWQAEPFIALWDETFNISYKSFRQRLNDIRLVNLSLIENIDIVKDVGQFDSLERGYRVLSTDDDDWFRPDIVYQLSLHESPILRWNYVEFCLDQTIVDQHPDSWRLKHFHYQTNNYCLTTPFSKSLVENHANADINLRGKEFYLQKNLSVHNKSLASISLNKVRCRRKDSLTLKDRLVSDFETCIKHDKVTVRGFEQCFELMNDLYSELRLR